MSKRLSTRNFCIVAHIDHGKSTLADRLLEQTKTIAANKMEEQVLDSMDLERERGITIKAHPVTLSYQAPDGKTYSLNLIDTPGHVDFSYEVSRSLAACNGALLLVDAVQGVQAQTMANYHLALNQGLEIIPIINKIDMPAADPERIKAEIEDFLVHPAEDAILVSAKAGWGIDEVFAGIVERIPPPAGNEDAPLRALVFDSQYDSYRGVVSYIRLFDGSVRKGDRIKFMSTGKTFDVDEVGIFRPQMTPVDALETGDVGYLMANIKNIADTRVGDTITLAETPATDPLPGYRDVLPMVYCGLYPIENTDYGLLRECLEKLKLNDAALVYEPETSLALGWGFRCGFLGLLHMEIVQERLERHYNVDLIATAPSVVYHVNLTNGEQLVIDNPEKLPDPTKVISIEEPMAKATIVVPEDYIGAVMDLAQTRRGVFGDMQYHGLNRCVLTYTIPLAEVITDFFDQLKSRTRGYASLDYEIVGYEPSDLVKLDILVHGNKVDALSCIVHREKSQTVGARLTEKLKEVIPRQQFEVPIQATCNGRIISRETVKAMRKNVLAKCYGGDITRKRKLLEKQKEGKRRMKTIGNVEIPQEAFLAVLRVDES
ncbi:MAG: translation elongation factor 4 [Candidatus Xenobia bacterium]